MNSQHAGPGLAGNVAVTPAGRLRGRRLLLARAGCVLAAVLLIGLFVLALPARHEQMIMLSDLPSGIDPDVVRANLKDTGLSIGLYAAFRVATEASFAAVCVGLATAIFWRRSDQRMALLVALILVLLGTTFWNTTTALALHDPVWSKVGQSLGIIGKMSLFLFFYLFPDGRFVPRWTRFAALVLVLGVAFEILFPGWPLAVTNWPAPLFLTFMVGCLSTGVLAQVYRYRRVSSLVERQQIKWVVLGFFAALTGFLGTIFLGEVLFSLVRPGTPSELFGTALITLFMLLIPLFITLAILRHRLFDIDLLINRTLVYSALTACVVFIYVFVVGYLGEVFRATNNLLVSLLATGIVAVLFAPLRDRLQRAVNRLMYGERDDPYEVISRLGERLEATLEPDAVLSTITRTVREALKLPYAAIALGTGERFVVAAENGSPVKTPLRLPLTYQGEIVGELRLAPRTPGEGFASADRRLLDDLTRQAGIAVHAVRLTADLQRSRERLVSTREEERRRLRRDLHDGLGPTLGSLPLKLDMVDDMMEQKPVAARELLRGLKEQSQGAVADIRRLVYELRPPALDELGLVGAIRETTAQYTRNGLRASVDAPEELPLLPAAVEVAAYRIAQEALTNVARHAAASECVVRVTLDETAGDLHLEIRDDGSGISPRRARGVGLSSMRERAEELGGTLVVESPTTGGSAVRATLPTTSFDDNAAAEG